MTKRIQTLADANDLLMDEIQRKGSALARATRDSSRGEAVVAAASRRDRLKFIQVRMN